MQASRKQGDFTVEFTTKTIKTPRDTKNPNAVILYDNYGHICGVFAKQEQADKAVPNIRKKIVAEYKRRDKLSK